MVFGSSNAFGHDVNEFEMVMLAGTVFVVSVLLVVVYKLARGWEDDDKDASILPIHGRQAARWMSARRDHFGQLGTIREDEVVMFDWKMR